MRFNLFTKGEPSRRVRNVIILLAVIVFAAFYLVGYNHPFSEDPDFIEPRLTSVLLIFLISVCVFAVAVAIWAVVRTFFKRGRASNDTLGVSPAVISTVVAVVTVAILAISFLAGSATAVVVNGQEYNDETWLKAVNMFVITSVFLMVLATAAVCLSTIWSHFIKRK